MTKKPLLSDSDPPKRMTHKGPFCTVGLMLNELDVDSAKALQAWLEDGGLTASDLSDHLRARGVPLGESTIRRHRRGRCQCH